MKRHVLAILLFVSASLTVYAQGFYFDIGIGFGSATTKIDGQNVNNLFGSSVEDLGVELGMKFGYGPVTNIPLYVVGEFSGIGHRFYDDYNYIQFNSYLIGPGIIYYPLSFVQLGTSIGFSFVSNQTDLPMQLYDSESGFAWNVYAALDIGEGNNACLIGIKYSKATNKLEVSGAEQETSLLSVFVKYAYRHKTNILIE